MATDLSASNSRSETPAPDSLQRLFTAIPLPEPVVHTLLPLQPSAGPAVRPVAGDNLHLTLCFIGPARVDEAHQRLLQLQASRFTLQLQGYGSFGNPRRGLLLWAGVAPSPALHQLQADMTTCLADLLPSRRERPYRPHITLARVRPGGPATIGQAFLQQPPPMNVTVEVPAFGLFSSVTTPQGSLYTCEHRYALQSSSASDQDRLY